jgi:hypothetical protein
MLKKKSFLILLSIIFSSCIGPRQYQAIHYYDFGQPKTQKTHLSIESFNVEGPYNERFVYRAQNNELMKDEYHRWAQAPDLLFTHYFKQAFQSQSPFSLFGEILSLEHNLENNTASLSVIYKISENGRLIHQKSFKRTFETNGTIESFVLKISKAVEEMTTEISTHLQSVK